MPEDTMSLEERLEKIKSPKLQNQRETAIVLSAIEDTLRDQSTPPTPTAYFAALLALLSQSISPGGTIVNPSLATSVVYLLDLITPHVPAPLLRAKFSQILTPLAPAITHRDAEAPLLRSSMGTLESLLVAQDAAAWALPQTQVGPRRAAAGLLALAADHRPKVRKRALEALVRTLAGAPPSPRVDHPAADMCAETALRSLRDMLASAGQGKRARGQKGPGEEHHPGLIHALQLVRTIAGAAGGWPGGRIDALCETLLDVARSANEYLTMAAFEVFETVFAGMAEQGAGARLPRLMEAIGELRPSRDDAQLLPPWIAVLSRGYDVAAQVDPEETFLKMPELCEMVAGFVSSGSHNIRISAAECLVSFIENCIPAGVILEPSVYDEKTLEKIGKIATGLLSVKYQAAWMEVFGVLGALFDTLKWQSNPLLSDVVRTVGELRGNESFNGKKEADAVLGKAVEAMGPEAVLDILPLNLAKPKAGQPGRAWLLPILRDNVINTNLAHFKAELVPLSEIMFQRVMDFGKAEKTMEIKIFETLVAQIWACLPGYCSLPLDLVESFDQGFAELLSNLLYQQTELRVDVCKSLQALVEMNKEISTVEGNEDLILQRRITKEAARKNLDHLSTFSGNILAVLFNAYSQTLPQYRGHILQCINAYLSITPEKELMETFTKVTTMLEAALLEATSQTQADKQKEKSSSDKMPPTSHTLMDLVITISVYLPPHCFATLFQMAALILPQSSDPQLQKKAYKLLPRLATSPAGIAALESRSTDLQAVLLNAAPSTSPPARRDRLAALATIITHMPPSTLHFIPSVLSEVVIAAKEVNEKARTAAFDLLVLMGRKMAAGGTIEQAKIPHMAADAPVAQASLEEYFTMVSAGLAGSTPHMISASVTALTRILYEFRSQLGESVLEDLVATMDLFLTSANREIVRSVLGFVKVAIISLPESIIRPRLQSLVTGLMGWSHEHKARFRAKVKHIFERLIRRFGFDDVERFCPEADRKLLANIRKTKERNKRKKESGEQEGEDEEQQGGGRRKGKFESEFDEAVYGSEEESDEGVQIGSDEDEPGSRRARRGGETYIVEDEDEPLDLLDKRALGNISSTRPAKARAVPTGRRTKAKVDLDGKLLFGGDEDGDVDMALGGEGEGTLEEGIGAYVDAIRGRDAVQRGRGGRLKFSNRKEKGAEIDADDDDEEDDGAVVMREAKGNRGGRGRERDGGRGRGGGKRVPERRGLEGRKGKSGSGRGIVAGRAGKVMKSAGRGGRGGRR